MTTKSKSNKDAKFITRKDKEDNSATVVKKGGKYDIGENPKYTKDSNKIFRGIAGAASAKVIKDSDKPERTAGTLRGLTANRRKEQQKK